MFIFMSNRDFRKYLGSYLLIIVTHYHYHCNYKKLQIRPKYFPQFHFSLVAASTEKICSRLYSALIVYWSLQKYLKVGKYFKSPPNFGAHTLISFFYSKQESNGLYHHKKQNNWKDFLCKKCCWFFPISVQ